MRDSLNKHLLQRNGTHGICPFHEAELEISSSSYYI